MIQRSTVCKNDCWDLTVLFESNDDWWVASQKVENEIRDLSKYTAKLSESSQVLLTYLNERFKVSECLERLGNYANLKRVEDLGDSYYQGMYSRVSHLYTLFAETISFENPEMLNFSESYKKSLFENPEIDTYRFFLEKILRYKGHILSVAEEKILAAYQEIESTPSKVFNALVNVDIKFKDIETLEGAEPLTNASYNTHMLNPDRNIREQAFEKFYEEFNQHKNTLSHTLIGSIKQDCLRARLYKFPSALEASIFKDHVSKDVYLGLIQSVNKNLDSLKRYYKLRKKVLGLKNLCTFDLKLPLIEEYVTEYSYEDAVDLCLSALKVMGNEYCETLREGLLNGWVDKYENQGKQQGAFSSSSYNGPPFILLNYQKNSFDSVLTLIHEAGHSMHSIYSKRNNPYHNYRYSIFVAEVASTFNEELLLRHLLNSSVDENFKTYLINKRVDDIIATLFRQTMFAEFELKAHELEERGESLTLESLNRVYSSLLEKYFGGVVDIREKNVLEYLRVPHFYSAFYVYKYSTGISAAISLANGVLQNPNENLPKYYKFLSSGGSQYPIDQLKIAGVDMTSTKAVDDALELFSDLVDQLEQRLK